MLTFEEALEKARTIRPDVNKCVEYKNGYFFCNTDDDNYDGGNHTPVVVLKEDGKLISFPTYLIWHNAPEVGEIKF